MRETDFDDDEESVSVGSTSELFYDAENDIWVDSDGGVYVTEEEWNDGSGDVSEDGTDNDIDTYMMGDETYESDACSDANRLSGEVDISDDVNVDHMDDDSGVDFDESDFDDFDAASDTAFF